MSMHTPAPWEIGEFDEHLGYDSMTAGIRVGKVYLDGADYGQKRCLPMYESEKEQMMADAKLISAAPDLLAELRECRSLLSAFETCSRNNFENLASERIESIDAALAKAEGE